VSLHSNAEEPAMLLRCGGMEQRFEKVGDSNYSDIVKLS
jgi:beta-mannosidase